jgi:hypothetical protein
VKGNADITAAAAANGADKLVKSRGRKAEVRFDVRRPQTYSNDRLPGTSCRAEVRFNRIGENVAGRSRAILSRMGSVVHDFVRRESALNCVLELVGTDNLCQERRAFYLAKNGRPRVRFYAVAEAQ